MLALRGIARDGSYACHEHVASAKRMLELSCRMGQKCSIMTKCNSKVLILAGPFCCLRHPYDQARLLSLLVKRAPEEAYRGLRGIGETRLSLYLNNWINACFSIIFCILALCNCHFKRLINHDNSPKNFITFTNRNATSSCKQISIIYSI